MVSETHLTSRPGEAQVVESRLSPNRIKQAGLAGVVSGSLLAVTGYFPEVKYTALGAEGTLGFTVLNLGYAVLFTFALFAILGAHALYRDSYSQLGRVGIYGLCAAFAGVTISFVASALAPAEMSVLEPVVFSSFLGMILFTSVVGVILWRRTAMSRVAAGLMSVVVPGFILFIALESTANAPHWLLYLLFEVPLCLGIAALGYHLWTHADDAQPAVVSTTG